MEQGRKNIVKSILRFLRDEINGNVLDSEQKESLDVARQCLESTYEVDSSAPSEALDLLSVFCVKEPEISEESQSKAEEHKRKGNEFMKSGEYSEALEQYYKAIEANSKNAVYYCNRAAAFSRLDKHTEAIADCREAIKLDPTYGKAYGRLGIAYSNMNMYKEAKDAYAKALHLDPTNTSYEANLKLAEERLQAVEGTASGMPPNFDFGSFMNNPALLNMASQMLNDPAFRNMVSGMIGTSTGGDRNVDAFMQLGQQLAQQMQSSNPNLIDNLRQSFGVPRPDDGGPPNDESENGDEPGKDN